jgi:hypothetical protein
MTILECLSCGHKFSSNEVKLTNVDITNECFRINWNYPPCKTEGLTTTFINNKKSKQYQNNKSNNQKK